MTATHKKPDDANSRSQQGKKNDPTHSEPIEPPPAEAGQRANSEGATSIGPRLVSIRMDAVKSEPVAWLWRHYIPMKAITVLDGDPGLGKTTMALDLGAKVTRGLPMPGESAALLPPAPVLVMSLEDSLSHTLAPRLEAAGADPLRVHFLTGVADVDDDGKPLERTPSIPKDVPLLSAMVRALGAKLVIIDPLMAALDSDVDAHKDQEIRQALNALARMADETGCAVVIIRHLNKTAGGSVTYRGGGSIGIVGAARSALLVAADPDNAEGRVFARYKGNLSAPPPGLRFGFVQHPSFEVASVAWGERCDISPDELVNQQVGQPSAGPKVKAATGWLLDLLESAADGWLPSNEVEDLAQLQKFSRTTLERARAALKKDQLLVQKQSRLDKRYFYIRQDSIPAWLEVHGNRRSANAEAA